MPKPRQLNHVTVLVTDKERAKAFYCDTLGLGVHTFGEDGKHLWARVGNQFIHISDNSGPPFVGNFCHFAIGFEDFRAFLDELIAKGIPVFDLDENIEEIDVNRNLDATMRQYFIRDPDGNLVEIFDINSTYFTPDPK